MNWKNLDLSEGSHERDLSLIDRFTFGDLLLMISCNIKEINKETIQKEFNQFLNDKIEEIKDVFQANLNNIVKQALKERNRK